MTNDILETLAEKELTIIAEINHLLSLVAPLARQLVASKVYFSDVKNRHIVSIEIVKTKPKRGLN